MLITDKTPLKLTKYQEINVDKFDFKQFYHEVDKSKDDVFVLLNKNPKKFFRQLKNSLLYIKAAGGLVANEESQYLFIFRNGKWDLPKGKVEEGEEVKLAAVREVEEECGVVVQKREYLICKTYHAYEMNEKLILKSTSWYKMRVQGSPELIPQTEEGIAQVEWLSASEIPSKMDNTFPSIKDVLKKETLFG